MTGTGDYNKVTAGAGDNNSAGSLAGNHNQVTAGGPGNHNTAVVGPGNHNRAITGTGHNNAAITGPGDDNFTRTGQGNNNATHTGPGATNLTQLGSGAGNTANGQPVTPRQYHAFTPGPEISTPPVDRSPLPHGPGEQGQQGPRPPGRFDTWYRSARTPRPSSALALRLPRMRRRARSSPSAESRRACVSSLRPTPASSSKDLTVPWLERSSQ